MWRHKTLHLKEPLCAVYRGGADHPIARWIAQRQGGSIEAVSRLQVGSRFTLVVPLLELGEL
ncbi:MAG: hypothetical protein LUD84_06855 [Clostridiales bacterium]|nr:hypothetical protein [Clostridiales bacterium]